ncbi:hypothetical protein SERLA73DRAFT_187434 [Serpula lacrymans var. lacrymans S7.3]|uniref:GATA-type domain-containing protein n=2 Tax=Serpula lacrymans var. lacrymans TaxID=341189 RepID=F8Q963_SERL3|nr:GATA-4/5/6 transcription factor [Serpula lacrymans var. lacrymans S7.9]EGN95118.1 hypothetical protein SERLA73DRAFT_187434 [Serpula lacrymans var. lacrymans S7.3]EGO20875.1 GATA-4/5/6 transcription factor [Serpula lacrymans var. lacrymans S7.9]
MSADNRYMYHNPQGMPPSYEYQPYPTSSYEPAQISQAPVRSIRSSSSQSHSPHQQTTFASPTSSYPPPTYAAASYTVAQSHQPQWTGENWPTYNQSYPQQQPMDMAFNPGPGRPEAIATVSSTENRPYGSGPVSQPSPEFRRNEERYVPPEPLSSPTQSNDKRREKGSPPIANMPVVPIGLDFMKLLDSYRLIIDASSSLSNNSSTSQGRPPPAETTERMLQSANYGMQMLESAIIPSNVEPKPVTNREEPKETAVNSKKQKPEDQVQEGQTCLGCNATSTPEWRRGPMGPRTLCNACGLVYAKLIKKRVRDSGRAKGGNDNGAQGQGSQNNGDEGFASSGEGGSEDEESYGSQERPSDFEDQGRRG